MGSTSVRLPDDLLQRLDELARHEHTDRSVVLRRAIERGVHTLRLEAAVEAYQQGRATAWAAATDAGVSLWELIDALKARGSGLATDEEHLRAELEAAG